MIRIKDDQYTGEMEIRAWGKKVFELGEARGGYFQVTNGNDQSVGKQFVLIIKLAVHINGRTAREGQRTVELIAYHSTLVNVKVMVCSGP